MGLYIINFCICPAFVERAHRVHEIISFDFRNLDEIQMNYSIDFPMRCERFLISDAGLIRPSTQ